MIFQGLFNILDLYFNESESFYKSVDDYFHKSIEAVSFRENLKETMEILLKNLIDEFTRLGFSEQEIENKFSDPFLNINIGDKGKFKTINDLYHQKFAPLIYEIFLERIVDYLVNTDIAPLMLKLKFNELLPLGFIMEMRRLKDLFEKNPDKIMNLRKYINIRDKIIQKFSDNKCKIEDLEVIKDPQDKLQLIYLIYRIVNFFHLENLYDFTKIKHYLKENIDEWLHAVPLVTLKNPDLYFCGLYLSRKLNVEIDEERVNNFLKEFYNENVDEFDAPIIEATDQIYYLFKSLNLMNIDLTIEEIEDLVKADSSFFEKQYLKNLETSQLVVILKMYNLMGLWNKIDKYKINALLEEVNQRITPEGIIQYRDGIISSEASYYVLFLAFMRDDLEKLKKYDILDSVVSRIYRNLEIIDFCRNTNFDLISEIFYSCESLKLFNCIETKEMIYHLAKYLFPPVILENGLFKKEINRESAQFRHLKVHKTTGQTIY